jgi:hypothetical protein
MFHCAINYGINNVLLFKYHKDRIIVPNCKYPNSFTRDLRVCTAGGEVSFGALLPSTLPTLQKEERALDHICDALSKIVATKPIFMLECLPDEAAARLSYTTIFGV